MKSKFITLALLSTTLLFSGCVGTGPNTQNDAVAGGALGAIAGAIIGGPHNALGGALIGGAAGAIAGGTLGNAQDHEDNTIYSTEVVSVPPYPAYSGDSGPGYGYPSNPGPDYYWINGYWAWNGSLYYWVNGCWASHRSGYIYVHPHWEGRPGGYHVFVRGHWHR
jgi:hypothetical protein